MDIATLSILGMNPASDKAILPEHYVYQEEPAYLGDGMYSVNQLQIICKQFKERCHQQAIIKSELIELLERPLF